MASNLPPGVNESMLPGNTAQDKADEALAERIWDILKPMREFAFVRTPGDMFTDNPEGEKIHEDTEMAIFALVSEAYSKGYQDSRDDEHMERQARALDKEPM